MYVAVIQATLERTAAGKPFVCTAVLVVESVWETKSACATLTGLEASAMCVLVKVCSFVQVNVVGR